MMAGGDGHQVLSTPGLGELFTLMNLLVVFGVIYLFGRKGIVQSLKDRAQNIADRLVKTREELKQMRAEIEVVRKQVANINEEKKLIVANVEEEGSKLARKLIDEAQETSKRIIEESKMAAKNEMQSVQQQMKAYLVESAIANGLAKINSGNDDQLNPQKMHGAFVEKFIKELPANLNAFHVGNNGGAHSNGHSI